MSPTQSKMDIDVESKINEIISENAANVEMETDFSGACEKTLPEVRKTAVEKSLEAALEDLLNLEKRVRAGRDAKSASKILVCAVQLCVEAANWDLLREQIVSLVKKRGQLKAAVADMVKECRKYIENGSVPDRTTEYSLIETLRTVTEGKIYVEVERARLTSRLASMKERDGKAEEAAAVLRELQVETYGSMSRKEKTELILEQMRLCSAVKDYIRTQIISKKINIRFFEDSDPEIQASKLKYYKYMIELDLHDGSYLNVCRHYRALFDTPVIRDDKEKRLETARHAALYVILSPYDNEQSDLLHRILREKVLEEIPVYKSLLEQFTDMQLISQADLCRLYEAELRGGNTDVFDRTERGVKRWNDLKSRVVEHNIRIMAKYYTRISLKRMAELLDLSENEAEEFLSGMVVNGTVEAKTDRLNGVVDFTRHRDPNDLLNEWSNNVSELMNLVMKGTHLINKEEMVHKLVHKEEA